MHVPFLVLAFSIVISSPSDPQPTGLLVSGGAVAIDGVGEAGLVTPLDTVKLFKPFNIVLFITPATKGICLVSDGVKGPLFAVAS